MSEEYKEIVKTKREQFIETLKTKLTIEDIQGLYDFFNVDDDVKMSMEHGVESLTPFGINGPDIKSHDSIEVYAMDRHAREFCQRLIRARFHQLINVKKEEVIKKKKSNTPT